MSDLPTPRYRIGDLVYRPQITATTEALPCPDCLGERVWHATTPAGVTHLLDCPRCQNRYSSAADKLPPLKLQRWVANVEEIRIGSIEARTSDSYRDRITYMTTTTGSGSVYGERDIFPTREAAQQVAETQAALKNAEVDRTAVAEALQTRVHDNLYEAWAAYRRVHRPIEVAGRREGTVMSVYRVRFKVAGGHVHCRLFCAKHPNQTYAKCGDFTVRRGEEMAALVAAFSGAEFVDEDENIGLIQADLPL